MDHPVYGWGVPVVGGVWESFGSKKGGRQFWIGCECIGYGVWGVYLVGVDKVHFVCRGSGCAGCGGWVACWVGVCVFVLC